MIKYNFKISVRTILKNKAFSGLNILGLSLGLIASIIIFLFINFHFSTDTFHTNYDRIFRVVLDKHIKDGTIEHEPGISIAFADALKNDFPQVEKSAVCMFFYAEPQIAIQREEGQQERFTESGVAYGNTDLLHMLDFEFLEGDKIAALDAPNSVVLTERQSRKYFNGLPALGRTLHMNNLAALTVTGVVKDFPSNTDFKVDVLVSLPTLKILNPGYQTENYTWVGRNNWVFVQLANQSDFHYVKSQLPSFALKYLGSQFNHWHYHLQPLPDLHFDQKYGGTIRKSLLYTLSLVSTFIILIACINFVNLSTALLLRRTKEIGMRKILGSTQQQAFWQYITETFIIVLISSLVAWVIILFSLPLLNNWVNVSLSLGQLFDFRLFFFITALLLMMVFIAGSYPALLLSSFNPVSSVKGKIPSGSFMHLTLKKGLVVIQFTVSLVLIVTTVVVVFQMRYLQQTDLGFDKETIITVKITKSEWTKLQGFNDVLLQNPGVVKVSFHHLPPMSNNNDGDYIRFNNREEREPFMVRSRWVDENYVNTYDLQIIAGRNIIQRDNLTEFIVNETFVKKLNLSNPDEVLGKEILDGNSGIEGIIVGVVNDFHHSSLQNPIEPFIIYPYTELFRQAGIKINSNNIQETIRAIQSSFDLLFPDQVFEHEYLDESIAKMYENEEVISRLTHIFSIVSVLICCLGVLGLSMLNAAQRIKEISIRKLLGASISNIVVLLSKEYVKLIFAAFCLSIPVASYFVNEWLSNFSYRITLAWWMFALPGMGLLIIALFTISWQSLKAALVDPVKNLKSDS